MIRRPQTPVICLPALPGKRKQREGKEKKGEEDGQDFFFFFSFSFALFIFLPFPWLGILSEVSEKKNRPPKAEKKNPYIHIYLMRREDAEGEEEGSEGDRQTERERRGKKLCYIWSASYN